MEDIFVGRLMSTGVETVSPDTFVEDAAKRLLEKNIGSLVVVDEDNGLEGILTSTDFVRVVAHGDAADTTRVRDHMSTEVVTVSAQDSIRDAADRIVTYDVHHMPVVDPDAGVVGMLSTTDLTAYISDVQKPTP